MKRILVTGAAGFLGSNVVDALIDRRRTVRAMRRPGTVAATVLGEEAVQGDVTKLADLIEATCGVDAIVHCAGKSTDHDRQGFERVNVEGTRNVCQAALASGVRKIIFPSTAGIYGHGIHQGTEESRQPAPDTDFSVSKVVAENLLLEFSKKTGIQVVVLRSRFIYGNRDRSVIPRLVRVLRRIPFLPDRGKARLSFVLARDFANVVCTALDAEGGAAAQIFNVTDGRPVRLRDVADSLSGLSQVPVPRYSLPLPLIYYPVRMAEKMLGMDPERSPLPVSSMRLLMLCQDNFFSNEKLTRQFPGLRFSSFAEGIEEATPYYRQFFPSLAAQRART